MTTAKQAFQERLSKMKQRDKIKVLKLEIQRQQGIVLVRYSEKNKRQAQRYVDQLIDQLLEEMQS